MRLLKRIGKLLMASLLPLSLLVSIQPGIAHVQDPAPPLSWQDWQLIGSCGGVDFLAAISADDGRNDFELKIKINNTNVHAIQTRINAVIYSESGQKKHRDNVGVGRLNGGRAVEACSTYPGLCFGALFPSAVYQKQPTRIAKLVLTKIDVANIDAPPGNTSPAIYLDPYRDYPHTTCRDLSTTFASGSNLRFISLTDTCVKGLPKWTKPDCDDAVEQILKTYAQATSQADQNCIREWRAYQKCYEIYAFNSNPVPRPSCERPSCQLKVK